MNSTREEITSTISRDGESLNSSQLGTLEQFNRPKLSGAAKRKRQRERMLAEAAERGDIVEEVDRAVVLPESPESFHQGLCGVANNVRRIQQMLEELEGKLGKATKNNGDEANIVEGNDSVEVPQSTLQGLCGVANNVKKFQQMLKEVEQKLGKVTRTDEDEVNIVEGRNAADGEVDGERPKPGRQRLSGAAKRKRRLQRMLAEAQNAVTTEEELPEDESDGVPYEDETVEELSDDELEDEVSDDESENEIPEDLIGMEIREGMYYITIYRRGVVDTDMTEADFTEFRTKLLQYIVTTDNLPCSPKFRRVSRRGNQAIALAENEETQEWLVSIVNSGSLDFWEGRARATKGLPKRHKMYFWVQNDNLSVPEVLSIIERQNPAISATQWRVWDHNLKGKQLRVVVALTQKLKNQLQRVGYSLYFGFSRIRVKFPPNIPML